MKFKLDAQSYVDLLAVGLDPTNVDRAANLVLGQSIGQLMATLQQLAQVTGPTKEYEQEFRECSAYLESLGEHASKRFAQRLLINLNVLLSKLIVDADKGKAS